MFLYLLSSQDLVSLGVCKGGLTRNPRPRLSTYLTGCPPGITPSHDYEYLYVWETNAATESELKHYEDILHDEYTENRLMRERPGDSEWFQFIVTDVAAPFAHVNKFVESQTWYVRTVPLEEVSHMQRPKRPYLSKNYFRNLGTYVHNTTERNNKLTNMQRPLVAELVGFLRDDEREAGVLVSPCGTGKTRMMCDALSDVADSIRRTIILVPSQLIQKQWKQQMVASNVFVQSQIQLVGQSGSTSKTEIDRIISRDSTFCIISTYASSHLLSDLIGPTVQLIVLDEAHHMAGFVPENDKDGEDGDDVSGHGKTRQLLNQAVKLSIQRISITFTPRNVRSSQEMEQDGKIFSMDDDYIFGREIASLNLREVISQGILPDYQLWAMYDEDVTANGLVAKVDCVIEAWNATEVVHDVVRPILHHLVIFAPCIDDAKRSQTYLAKRVNEPVILVEGGNPIETSQKIERFKSLERAIIVNCRVLNEGVDIPVVNGVCVLSPGNSCEQLTQMILRAGRAYENKSIFHILMPFAFDEKHNESLNNVIFTLAQHDTRMESEVRAQATNTTTARVHQDNSQHMAVGSGCKHIQIECFDSAEWMSTVKSVFTRIYQNRTRTDTSYVRQLCQDLQIETSLEYYELCGDKMEHLPKNPLPKDVTWYDFLHPGAEKHDITEFLASVPEHEKNIRTYDTWREEFKHLPSHQHIADGYFGSSHTNLTNIFSKPKQRRRR